MFCPTIRESSLRGPLSQCDNNSFKGCASAAADIKTYDSDHAKPHGAGRSSKNRIFNAEKVNINYVAKGFGPKQR